ncbi:DNA-processing protein DprA [Herbiconiux daphne]|uniref:DNA-processing protein DprA n=1 Tax=Herbiconiux daphne TaxID=2970914 RepID=A0ABT2GYJ1_9MICO|nr:DNA-processing protein DprA [Herbiconiux daphne]MCS5733024.1 DNA-processing protein DprA [Herbiconiux daphne]
MSVYELDTALVRSLIEKTSAAGPGVELDDAAIARLFATAAWSLLAEPGDAIAGFVVAALGADRALSMLIEQRQPEDWLAALAALPAGGHDLADADLAGAFDRWRPRLSSRLVVAALRSAAHCRARLLSPADDAWPRGFEALGEHAPLALWVRGDVRRLNHPGGSVAIVGSRDATNYGEHVAMDLASGLCDRGFAVVSGAAYGIDGMAHRAAIASRGTTIAYLAGGVDRLYPAAHHDLLLRIEAVGAIASEVACGAAPTKWRFLQRNRLIAAASHATVVVEAGRRSGSLNTAGHAAAMGRPLGAVPGPVTSVTSAGCHRLMREFDAVCVTSAAEVVELVLGPVDVPLPGFREAESGADSESVRVLDSLSRRSARSTADISQRAGMSPRAVAGVLGALALDGAVRETPIGWTRT